MKPEQKLEHLVKVISSQRFLKKEGIGKEIPFFIASFAPTEALEMERVQKNLFQELEQRDLKILVINLYDLCIDLLKKRGLWDQILNAETTVSKEELKELLQGVLDPETHLIPEIKERLQTVHQVLFITGVGEVFPYLRSHNILNNLQSATRGTPAIMFFPGEYSYSGDSGSSLNLFGKLHDDKYYRAFNIFDYEV